MHFFYSLDASFARTPVIYVPYQFPVPSSQNQKGKSSDYIVCRPNSEDAVIKSSYCSGGSLRLGWCMRWLFWPRIRRSKVPDDSGGNSRRWRLVFRG
jgi:hypothetical protein